MVKHRNGVGKFFCAVEVRMWAFGTQPPVPGTTVIIAGFHRLHTARPRRGLPQTQLPCDVLELKVWCSTFGPPQTAAHAGLCRLLNALPLIKLVKNGACWCAPDLTRMSGASRWPPDLLAVSAFAGVVRSPTHSLGHKPKGQNRLPFNSHYLFPRVTSGSFELPLVPCC
jgi:hypothetical protein